MKHIKVKCCTTCGEAKTETAEFFPYSTQRWTEFISECRLCWNARAYRWRRKKKGTFIGPPIPPGYRVMNGRIYRK